MLNFLAKILKFFRDLWSSHEVKYFFTRGIQNLRNLWHVLHHVSLHVLVQLRVFIQETPEKIDNSDFRAHDLPEERLSSEILGFERRNAHGLFGHL